MDGGVSDGGEGLQLFFGADVLEIALVELHHQGDLLRVELVPGEVGHEVGEGLAVLVGLGEPAVGDEGDGVRFLEHDLAGAVVEDLPRHGVELQLDAEVVPGAEVDREQVEEEGAIVAGLQVHQPAGAAGGHHAVDGLEVGGLPAERRTVIHDFERQLALAHVELDHGAAFSVDERGSPSTRHDPSGT